MTEKEEYSSDSEGEYDGEEEDSSSGDEIDDDKPRSFNIPSMTKLSIKQDLNESYQSRMNEDTLLKKKKYGISFYDYKITPKKKLLEREFYGLDDLSIIKSTLSKELSVDYSSIAFHYNMDTLSQKRIGPDLLCVNDIYEEIEVSNDEKIVYVEIMQK